MANLSVSAHGTSFHVEDLSRVDSAIRRGWGLEVAAYRHGGYPGPAAWVHAPVPLVAAWDLDPLLIVGDRVVWAEVEERVRLTEVAVEFNASADEALHVRDLHVWNGATRVAHFDDLSERGPEYARVFDPPLEVQGWIGLNLSIGIEFPINRDTLNPAPPPALVFSAAYAFFIVDRA